ncbi:MAG: nucleoside kinase [Paludibacteraceae bacterium]|nr:nucleoside kinase [Paludibacteraceae bacterium]
MNKYIEIFCKNNKKKALIPFGKSLSEVYDDLKIELPYAVVAARVNNKIESLSYSLYRNKTIEFIDLSNESGMRVYVRSLVFVLFKAIIDLIPNGRLRVEHPVSKGYYCEITSNGEKISLEQLAEIKHRMRRIISQDIHYVSEDKPTSEAIEVFSKHEKQDNVDLLKTYKNYYTEYHTLDGLPDFYSGALLPSTGYLSIFDILPYLDGFLLQVPKRNHPVILEDIIVQDKLAGVFADHYKWCRIMGINNIGDFNSIDKCNLGDFIKVTEALHEKQISKTADFIANQQAKIKMVLVSGPSSSGKTTFTKRLSVQLMASGIKPLSLSLDNYFVDREKTPLDEKGEYDFESLYALDIEHFNEQLNQLLLGEEVRLPTFNFETGKREFKGNRLCLLPENILIIEGIHALNPTLTANIAEDVKYKIYVSALTTLSLNDHNWIPTTDTRILRRLIRDYKYRGYSAIDTLMRWSSVRKGEEKWIFPFQENADAMFNSSLIFELAALKKQAEPILLEVHHDSEAYPEAHRLLKLLQYFKPIPYGEIPATSLLREFLGKSGFRY